MVRTIIEEEITPAEAVARQILTPTQANLVTSVKKIGAGGFGDIYKMCLRRPITNQRLEGSPWETAVHSIARKIIEVSKPKEMEEYRNEVEAMKTLCNESHVNMIQYIDDGAIVSKSIYFIDMELCDINLSQYIRGTQKVTGVHGLPAWNKENPDIFLIIAIMQQLLSGLAFMHKEHKVHRDLDPRNATYGWWKIADFGLTSSGTTEDHNTTQAGRGKEGYRAAELVREGKKTFNKKTDIWSLGCILHDLCVGERAFGTDVAAWDYSLKKEPLQIAFSPSLQGAAEIVFGSWIREMIDWDPARRPTPEVLGKQFWQLLFLVVPPSPTSKTLQTTWKNTDLLLPKNLISTDSPSNNQAMMTQIPPRWEHLLFQGSHYSHNMKTLERAKQIAVARENLLGESHPQTMHSKVRLAWTSFYMPQNSIANSSEEFKKLLDLKSLNELADRETASYLAGIGWSEYSSENYDESLLMFQKALEIQSDHLLDSDSLSYTVALAKVQLAKALTTVKKPGRKRKRSTSDDVGSTKSTALDAVSQLHLSYNCQRFNPKLGKEHIETAETMMSLAFGYRVLAIMKKLELAPTKVLRQYYQSTENFLNEALEVEREGLGGDHPHTLYTLHEVAHIDLKEGRTAEGIQKLEEVLAKQKYVLGIDDPDTQATISSLREGYRLCGETKKSRDLLSLVGNIPPRVNQRMLRMCDLENGTDNEGDNHRVDQPSSQASPSQASL